MLSLCFVTFFLLGTKTVTKTHNIHHFFRLQILRESKTYNQHLQQFLSAHVIPEFQVGARDIHEVAVSRAVSMLGLHVPTCLQTCLCAFRLPQSCKIQFWCLTCWLLWQLTHSQV